MKAFLVTRYGKDEIRAADVPAPTVGSRDVLVKVSASTAVGTASASRP